MGVVGVGSLGFHHVRILRTLPEVRMAGFHEIRAERAGDVAGELGVEAHPTLDDLLERVDAVVIAVPTDAHEAVAVSALERGVSVLIEKPMAPTLEAANRILEAAVGRNVVVQIGHVERFNGAVIAAERYLEAPLFIESHRLAPFVPRSTDVAVVLDLMIHDVDLVRSLLGTPIRDIAATGIPVLTPNVDIANARLTFESGAVANLTASRVSMEKMRKLRIFQPSGYLSLNLAEETGEFLRLRGSLSALGGKASPGGRSRTSPDDPPIREGLDSLVERITFSGNEREPLSRELENFRDAVLGRVEPAVTGEAGREALAVSLSIEERIESHVVDQSPA